MVEKTRVDAENIMQIEMPKKLVHLNELSKVGRGVSSSDARRRFSLAFPI